MIKEDRRKLVAANSRGGTDKTRRNGYLKEFSSVGLPFKILKALLPSSFLATCSAHLNVLDLITLIILDEWYKL